MNTNGSVLRGLIKQPAVLLSDLLARLVAYHFVPGTPWYTKLTHIFARYEPETTRYIRRTLKPGATFVDVGANLGYFTRLASKSVGPSGTVYAFEPDRYNFELLLKNTKHLKNVRIYNTAISNVVGEVDLFLSDKMGWHSLIHQKENTAGIEKVACTTIDAMFKDIKVDMIKIDVEGAESKVFEGMSETLYLHPVVVFEYNPWDSKELVDVLQGHHAIYRISRDGSLEKTTDAASRLQGKKGANLVLDDTQYF